MITSEQVRAARALLRWTRQDLVNASGVSLSAIKRMEGISGPLRAHYGTVQKIAGCLEDNGVVFEDGGVRSVLDA